MAPKRKEVRSIYISDDISFSVLSKLPVKSLNRFSCVRKSWNNLFGNPNFINMFRKNLLSKSDENDVCLILNWSVAYHWNLYLLSDDNFQNKVKLNYPSQFHIGQNGQNDVDFFRILRYAVNGTLCVYDWDGRRNVVLWNPTTSEIKVVPHGFAKISNSYKVTVEVTLHGFGYDHVRDDYKVIQHVNYVDFDDDTHDSFWEIYSLKSNSWRKLGFGSFDMPPTPRYLSTYANSYMDGMCHWLGDDIIEGTCVMSFNLSKEIFFITPLPFMRSRFDDDNMPVLNNLFVLNGHFTMITYHKKTKTKSFRISILGEFGVKESWVRLFDIGPLSCIEHPIGAGKNNVFFRKEDDELVCFNLTTGMIEEIGVKGEECWCQMIIYKKNLHPIGGMNN